MKSLAARADALAEMGHDLAGHQKLLVLGPAVGDFRQADFLFAQRRSVGVVAAGLVRRAETDHAAHDDQRRPVGGERPRAIARAGPLQLVGLAGHKRRPGRRLGIAERRHALRSAGRSLTSLTQSTFHP